MTSQHDASAVIKEEYESDDSESTHECYNFVESVYIKEEKLDDEAVEDDCIERCKEDLAAQTNECHSIAYLNQRDRDRIIRLLRESDVTENFQSEISDAADTDEEDHIEINAEESSTEEENEEPEITNGDFFIGKDKTTKWWKSPQQNRSQIIVTEKPGVKGAAKDKKTPLETWNLFFSDRVIEIIVKNTNKCIESIAKNYSRKRDVVPTDKIEIEALLGILFFAGLQSSLHVKDFFRMDGSAPEIFRLAMNSSRFTLLLKCLCFDDKKTRPERLALDKLAPIRELYEEINSTFCKYYSATNCVTIDERLERFRGNCNFRQHIPSKPSMYGLKVNALTDSNTFYTLKMEPYVGRQLDGPYKVDTTQIAIVERLCDVIYQTGRNITMNKRITSIDLAKLLLEKHKLTTVGTISKNKAEIPQYFCQNRGTGSYLFGFEEKCTLVSYIPKKGENLLIISTMHATSINTQTSDIVASYNAAKGAVETAEKLCASYDCSRGTNRWPMVLFYGLMNVSALNAFIIYTENTPESKLVRKAFLEKLAFALMEKHLSRRAACLNVAKLTRERLAQLCDVSPPGTSARSQPPGRCCFCSTKKNRRTKYNCLKCQRYFCLEHAMMVCQDCYIVAFENE